MSDNPSDFLSKIKSLEAQLQDQDDLTNKYKEALSSSNHRIEQIAKNLKEGLSLIAEIHRHLLPVDLPEIPYFEFSYKFLPTSIGVSGDFFDVVKIRNSLKFGIIISSCNTYAMSALFISSFLKSSQRLHDYKTSKDFLSYVSESLSKSFSEIEKIDLFYGIIDRKTFSLDYCLVGDIFAGFKKEGQDYQILEPCSKTLRDKKTFKNKTISLDAKDIFMFCSAGVKTNENSKKEEFGVSNILKAACEGEEKGVLGIRQNVLFQCNKFNKGIKSTKDRTVLVMEVKDRILKLTKLSKS